jgi:hypothetical protein
VPLTLSDRLGNVVLVGPSWLVAGGGFDHCGILTTHKLLKIRNYRSYKTAQFAIVQDRDRTRDRSRSAVFANKAALNTEGSGLPQVLPALLYWIVRERDTKAIQFLTRWLPDWCPLWEKVPGEQRWRLVYLRACTCRCKRDYP